MGRGSALAVAGSGLALLAAAPSPVAAVGTLAAPTAAPDPLAPLLSLIALVAWCLIAWLLVAAVVVAASRVPGLGGQMAGRLASRIAPAGIRRILEVTLGLSV